MNAQTLNNLVQWLSYERFASLSSAYYASFVLANRSFSTGPSWVAIQQVSQIVGIAPELIIGTLLYLGAVLVTVGIWRNSSAIRLYGAACSFTVFSILCISQVATLPHSTGVPAYSILAGAHLLAMLRRASNTEWIPFTHT